jgi:hypothetical protein
MNLKYEGYRDVVWTNVSRGKNQLSVHMNEGMNFWISGKANNFLNSRNISLSKKLGLVRWD